MKLHLKLFDRSFNIVRTMELDASALLLSVEDHSVIPVFAAVDIGNDSYFISSIKDSDFSQVVEDLDKGKGPFRLKINFVNLSPPDSEV